MDVTRSTGSNPATSNPNLPRRVFKVVLVGEVNVGKTSLFQRLRVGRFQEWGTTIGVDQHTKDYEIDGTIVTLQVWDTAGSEKYRTLTANYYHSAAGCIYVYDLSAVDSLYNLSTWADDAQRFEPKHGMFLVGNKCDLSEDDIAVEDSTIKAFHDELEFALAKKRQDVDETPPPASLTRTLSGVFRRTRKPEPLWVTELANSFCTAQRTSTWHGSYCAINGAGLPSSKTTFESWSSLLA